MTENFMTSVDILNPQLDKDTDKHGLKTMLEDASSEIHLILELGNRWLSLGGKYVEVEYGNFEYIKKQ